MLILWLLLVIIAYFGVVFLILPRLVPFMTKRPLPSKVPEQVKYEIKQLEKESDSKYSYLRNMYELLTTSAHGKHLFTLTHPALAFQSNLESLVRRSGPMHCNQLAHLARLYLVNSKFFTDDDIRLRLTFLNLFVHVYLQVKIHGQWYDVDLWGKANGVPLGKHSRGFR